MTRSLATTLARTRTELNGHSQVHLSLTFHNLVDIVAC